MEFVWVVFLLSASHVRKGWDRNAISSLEKYVTTDQ